MEKAFMPRRQDHVLYREYSLVSKRTVCDNIIIKVKEANHTRHLTVHHFLFLL
jgi:hypothetical protein